MKDIIEKIEKKMEALGEHGFEDRNSTILSNDRDWHDLHNLVAQLKGRVNLLNANPDMSHGLRPAPDAAKLSN